MAARPDNVNEPIPCKTMVAKDKLLAEGSLSETKMILGWLFNFRTLTVSLQNHKFIAWKAGIQKMITSKHTTSKDLDTIWLMGHVGFVIPWVCHFISPHCYLHYCIKIRRFITVNDTCMKDLELMKDILAKTKMEPTHIPSAQPDVLFRFVHSWAWGIQRLRACMAFSCPSPPPISSDQQSTGISCSNNHPLDWLACRPPEMWRLCLVDDW